MTQINANPDKSYTIDYAISKDGTKIGYRQYGRGHGIILVHGGMMAAQNFNKLAIALSDTYTVFVPDRRGRGMSGPHGDNYSLAKECDDIHALINKTRAHNIFGLSSGAIVVLQSALTLSSIHKVALYEPPFAVKGTNPAVWVSRYERELAQGKLGAAMVSILKKTSDNWSIGMLPRFILEPLISHALEAEARKTKEGEVPLKALILTMHYDSQLVAETEGKTDRFKDVHASVLLLGGSRSRDYLKRALDALNIVLPRSHRIQFPHMGHLAADNSGKPELVANELKHFFGNTQ